ncbi:MAG: nucleoside hydrolase [Firmicutes bacterium]|nr:nucleoside hydrolase [Bacillota bacterium]
MRKFIIDTDTASDDCAALMMACMTKDIEIMGVTVVAGNVSVEQAGKNAKMTLEVCGNDAPVFLGAKQPLMHARKETISVHGVDGMGDKGLIHPQGGFAPGDAVDYILNTVAEYPDEIEIVVLGPVTNVALAILRDRETMSHVKRIWSMGTPGFGPGNATPVAEFNVYIDAEAYKIMLDSGIPVSIAGFDLCVGDIEIDLDELAEIAAASPQGAFLKDATAVLLDFNRKTRGQDLIDLPDAVAMACSIWPETVADRINVYCYTCIDNGPCYGQVIFYREGSTYESMPDIPGYPDEVITAMDVEGFTKRFLGMFKEQ